MSKWEEKDQLRLQARRQREQRWAERQEVKSTDPTTAPDLPILRLRETVRDGATEREVVHDGQEAVVREML